MKWGPGCPICGSQSLFEFNGRKAARCSNCHSMERTRCSWMLMERHGIIRKGMSVLHFAPEVGMSKRLRELASDYVSADFDVSQYKVFLPDTVKIDLCDLDEVKFEGRFDLIIHNHVLEHLFCDVKVVLRKLVKFLKKDGSMYFSVPVRAAENTKEDFDTSLPEQERQRLFGQHDHVRLFGARDVVSIFKDALGPNLRAVVPQTELSASEMRLFGIPLEEDVSGNTIFVYKNSNKKKAG